jgi:hypothetical protein
VTRSTTKALPLAADDVAGISVLYPTPGYLASTGSIIGNVTLNGGGVSLASVVALSPTTGIAISNLTNPDGSYRIDAVPPGNYLLYVHPLPPAAQGEAGPDAIVLPQDAAQNPFPANTGFVTQFFPGTRDWTQAQTLSVYAGNTVQYVNFNVQGSAGPVVYGMQLSGGVNNAVEASPMLEGNGSFSLEFTAPGTTVGTQLAPGLNVSVIGSQAPASVVPGYTKYYTQGYVSLGVYTSSVLSTTPVALAVTVANDLYVLPAAFFVVPSGPPTLTSLSPGTDQYGNGTLTVNGNSLSSSTQFVFDGTVATILSANADGSFTLGAPPAPGPYSSSIEALNPDGQTSGQAIVFGNPPQYQYNYANPAQIQVSPSTLLPGTDTKVQINGNNTNFLNGQPVVGFGSSDIVVKQIFVIGPGLLQVNVSVNPQAPPTATTVTVTTGLQTATETLYAQVLAANPNQISLHAPVINAVTGLAGVPAGGAAIINVTGIPQILTGWTLTIGNQLVNPVLLNGQLQVIIPNGLPIGPALVQLTSPSGAIIPPIVMKIDAPPPVISSVTSVSGAQISASQPAHPGDILILNVIGLADGVTALTPANMFATVGGVPVPVIQVSDPQVAIQLPQSVPTGTAVPLYLGVGTRLSSAFSLNIHN